MNYQHYAKLALLFDYPDQPDFQSRVREVQQFVGANYPEVASEIDKFVELMPEIDPHYPEKAANDLCDVFTRSFDVQSVTTLDIGYTMFGDDYKRGELLVNLRREHRTAGVECGIELGDHLPNLLRLIATSENVPMVVELVEEIIAPVLGVMVCEFNPERMIQKNKIYKKHYKTIIDSSAERSLIYSHAIRTLHHIICQDFEISERQKPEPSSDFLSSIGRELAIEKREVRT